MAKKVGVKPGQLSGKVTRVDQQNVARTPLTKLEKQARREAKSQSIRIAAYYGDMGNASSQAISQADQNFYSPQLSTDFLELPQSEREKRELLRFWYSTHPIIGAGIDFHTDVPMSKIRLAAPKGKDTKKNKQILHFFEKMCRRLRLFQVLYDITHEYWLHGNVFIFCEDHDLTGEIPEELMPGPVNDRERPEDVDPEIVEEEDDDSDGEDEDEDEKTETTATTETVKQSPEDAAKNRSKNIQKFVEEKYEGWQRLQILPPEQVKLEIFQYTNRVTMELIPSEKDRLAVLKAQEQNDPESQKIAEDIPDQIRENLLSGQPIPLNTTPYDDFLCSSFCYHLAHKRSPYDDRGISILERCLRTLLYQDKLRQAQTSIASRAMTPKRIIWGDKMSQPDVDDLRDQIDQALVDPDFTIITNFEVHWDEVGARDRLLDLSTEYDITNKLLFIGLRITESMLTGESTYSGERIHLDVMNTMYLLYRETLADFVEQYLFAPVAEKKGFWEEDEYGNKNLLFPQLQFTRLALRDNTEMQDFMFNLYQKGSMPIDYIYELLNIDSEDAHILLKRDLLTPKDATFNEIIRSLYTKIGDEMATKTDAMKKVATNMGLTITEEEGDRFGKESPP